MKSSFSNFTRSIPFLIGLILILSGTTRAIEGDITGDGAVDWNDVNALSLNWLDSNCSTANGRCSGADIDESNSVDFSDFAMLANNWQKTADFLPPITQWLKGSIHFHTTNSDGILDLATMMGYYSPHRDFACVTDHDYISNANAYTTSIFLGVNGYEASGTGSTEGPHVVGFGMNSLGAVSPPANLQLRINYVISGGGLPMIAHPAWSHDVQGYDISTLMANMTNCNLIAVYNYRCERIWHDGNSESYWDALLSSGKVIYGYSEDDAHGGGDTGYTFNSVEVTSLTLASIKTAMQNGNFYFGFTKTKWTAGITITSYRIGGTRIGNTINIFTNGGQTIQFIGKNGSILQTVNSKEARYTINGTEQYVRIKITDAVGDITWTQPVFVTP